MREVDHECKVLDGVVTPMNIKFKRVCTCSCLFTLPCVRLKRFVATLVFRSWRPFRNTIAGAMPNQGKVSYMYVRQD